METLTPADYSAMQACIDIMRRESPDCAKQIDAKIKFEGYEAAGEFAACHVCLSTMRVILGYCRSIGMRHWISSSLHSASK
jgi:hypothetical protein